MLDPIDGTKGFVRGAQYAVALGLLEDGKVRAAARLTRVLCGAPKLLLTAGVPCGCAQVTMGVLGCPNLPLAGLPPAENAISVARGPTGGSLMFAARVRCGCAALSQPRSQCPSTRAAHVAGLRRLASGAWRARLGGRAACFGGRVARRRLRALHGKCVRAPRHNARSRVPIGALLTGARSLGPPRRAALDRGCVRAHRARGRADAHRRAAHPHGLTGELPARGRGLQLSETDHRAWRVLQAKYALMARGDADLYLRFPPADYSEKARKRAQTGADGLRADRAFRLRRLPLPCVLLTSPLFLAAHQIWDHAAGSIIVEEAGGVMQDAAGEPLDFGTGRTLRIAGGIVGCPPQARSTRQRGAMRHGRPPHAIYCRRTLCTRRPCLARR